MQENADLVVRCYGKVWVVMWQGKPVLQAEREQDLAVGSREVGGTHTKRKRTIKRPKRMNGNKIAEE